MKKIGFLLSFVAFLTHGQIDFKNFTTLQSVGTIPSDFADLASEKVANDKGRNDNLSEKSDEFFKRNVHYSMDQMLHSGQCVYGDPISVYIDKIAQKLLKDDQELYSKLRFYTLKSNVSNAFSTHQGIIVFTTGLISQFANETQLAYVLAHEIVHYKENHVVQTFEWKLQNKYSRENLNQFNNYSKDKEFEADSKAVDICLNAGYSATEIYNSFDVLMFSHLPFDEIKFPIDYFNNSLLFVPEKEFTTEKFPIKIDEAYDDKNSTHPNVEKRKETIHPFLEKRFGEGTANIGSIDEFNLIRNCARFESVRTSLLDVEYAKALYQIFLLDKEFPQNYTLTRWKAHAWTGLLRAKINGFWSDAVVSKKSLEGESAVLYEYIRKLDKFALATHALRAITDGLKAFPESEELTQLRTSTMKVLASNNWSWSKYSKVPFEEAFAPLNDTLSVKTDSLEVKEVKESTSKYDRIKGAGTGSKTTSVSINDSTKYFYFGLSDLMSNSSFLNEFKEYQTEYDTKQEVKKQKKTNKKDTKPIIGERLIVVEPTTTYVKNRKLNFEKGDQYQNKLAEAIQEVANKQNVKLFNYSTSTLKENGTDAFNQRSTMMNYLRQFASLKEPENFVSVDFELIQKIQQNCGTTKVLFSWTDYSANTKRPLGAVIVGTTVPLMFPAMFLLGLSKYKDVEIIFVVIDLEKGQVEYSQSRNIDSAGGKLILKSEAYNLFKSKK